MALFRVSSGFDPVSGLLGLQRELVHREVRRRKRQRLRQVLLQIVQALRSCTHARRGFVNPGQGHGAGSQV